MIDRTELLKRLYEDEQEGLFALKFLERKYIGFKHRFQVNSGMCFCMFNYLPYSYRLEPFMIESIARSVVFNFKKGELSYDAANLLAAAVAGDKLLGCFPGEAILLTIPASSVEKHERRFRTFSKILSENLGIRDGFSLLNVTDRPDRRTSLKESVTIHDPEGLITGRPIVLADDVYASGHSFDTVSKLLLDAGAKSITGLFLAKSIPRSELYVNV